MDFAETRKELGLGFIWGFLVTRSRIRGRGTERGQKWKSEQFGVKARNEEEVRRHEFRKRTVLPSVPNGGLLHLLRLT